ncbi:MAG: hypothetical protein WCX65_15540 [bacterium]
MSSKTKKLNELLKQLSPEAVEPLRQILKDGVISKAEFKDMLKLLSDMFDELLNDTPNTKRMERKLRELIMSFGDLKYESEVTDETLKNAVKLIREKIIGRGQRESLARLIAEELVADWAKADRKFIERIADDEGIIEQLNDLADDGPDFDDAELSELLVELGGMLAVRYAGKLSDADLDSLLDRSHEIVKDIEAKKNISDSLLEAARDGMQALGIISLMRRAFSGLLLGDLILRQVGKSLNIKGNTTVTDFIIFIGAKVAENESIKKAKPAEIERVRKAIEAARSI